MHKRTLNNFSTRAKAWVVCIDTIFLFAAELILWLFCQLFDDMSTMGPHLDSQGAPHTYAA